jgi:hypothetical protein
LGETPDDRRLKDEIRLHAYYRFWREVRRRVVISTTGFVPRRNFETV